MVMELISSNFRLILCMFTISRHGSCETPIVHYVDSDLNTILAAVDYHSYLKIENKTLLETWCI